MSEIHYACPGCQSTLTVAGRAGGRTLPCPFCGQQAVVPVSLPVPETLIVARPLLRQRPRSGCAIGGVTLLVTLLSVAGAWAWFVFARESGKDLDGVAPAAATSRNEQRAKRVQASRSKRDNAEVATASVRLLDKQWDDLMRKQEREQVQFKELFQRRQRDAAEYTAYLRLVAERRMEPNATLASYERVQLSDRQIVAALQEILRTHREQAKVAQARLRHEADPVARRLLDEYSAVIRDNVEREERLLASVEGDIEERKKFRHDYLDDSRGDKEGRAEAGTGSKQSAAEQEEGRGRLEGALKWEAAQQRQKTIDQEEKEARKLLRAALQLNTQTGFARQVRQRLQEIIDKYPDTPSAEKARRQIERLAR